MATCGACWRSSTGEADDAVGGLTIYSQSASPDAELKANWLPVPDAPFYSWLRTYWPKEAILDGQWLPPTMEPQS